MNITKEQSIVYHRDKNGWWFRTSWKPQCPDIDILGSHCQGVSGHKGCHWAYKPDGSYAYWKNDADSGSIEEDVAAGIIPPDNKAYVHPIEKLKEYYMKFHSSSKVVDEDIIQKLEKNETPEENASIDRPLSFEEVKKLKEEGILPKDA